MTTRHASAENSYPFVPTGSVLPVGAAGITDLFFAIQGPGETQDPTNSSESSSGGPVQTVNHVSLKGYVVGAGITTYAFRAETADRIFFWDVYFEVPHNTTGTGVVKNLPGTDVRAVLTYNANNVVKTGSDVLDLLVEYTRAVFYTERVTKISFLNEYRCEGVEDPSAKELVVEIGPTDTIQLGNGYNCTVSAEDSLIFTGEKDAGLGTVPSVSFGNTNSCGNSSSGGGLPNADISLVRSINGITPADGNLVVNSSRLIGKEKTRGRLTLTVRQS